MIRRVFAATAALSLAASPALAASNPAPVPAAVQPTAEEADGMALFGGNGSIATVAFLGLVIIAIVIAMSGSDKPASP